MQFTLNPKRWGLVLLVSVAWAGCGDDKADQTAPPAPNNDPGPDATPEPNPDPNPQPAPNPDPEPACDCDTEAGEHCVAGECLDRFDRGCATDADCRENETCQDVGGVLACLRGPSPIMVCPGDAGCESHDGPLEAGAAKAVLTMAFEQARREFLNGVEFEGDPDDPDTFIDCGLDQLCEGDPGYPGPDFGEGDGHMQGAWIAGYGHSRPAFRYCPGQPDDLCDPDKPWEGELAHDDVFVRVVVLRQGDVSVALVVVDGVGFFYDRERSIRALLPESVGVDLLVIGATHVHEAPDMVGQWGPGFGGQELPVSTGAEPYWLAHIDQKVADAIEAAWDGLEPAKAQATTIKTGVEGLAVDDGRDPWVFDDEMPVLRLSRTGDAGGTIATIFNWGQHAETRGDDNQHITADFPGAAIRYIEQGLPEVVDDGGNVIAPAVDSVEGGGVAVFFAGAVGGIIGPGGAVAVDRAGTMHRAPTWEKVEAIGQQLAERVLAVSPVGQAPVLDDPKLRVVSREFTVPVDNTQFQIAILGLRLFDREIYNATTAIPFGEQNRPAALTRATMITLGPVTFFTVPGEIFPELLVGGYDAGTDYAFEPWLGDPEQPFCGEDMLPLPCDEGCPEGWGCREGHCLVDPPRCGESSDCGEGFECLDTDVSPDSVNRRCLSSCVDNDGCAEGFVCLGEVGGCFFSPELTQALAIGQRCLVSPRNPNPPALDEAPAGPYLKERLPGEVIFTLGLTHDELGYIVPPYDFKLDPDGPYIIEPPGDHYTETNSTGPMAWEGYVEQIEALLEALGQQ